MSMTRPCRDLFAESLASNLIVFPFFYCLLSKPFDCLTYSSISFCCRHSLLFEDVGGEFNIPMAANAETVRDFDEGLTRG